MNGAWYDVQQMIHYIDPLTDTPNDLFVFFGAAIVILYMIYKNDCEGKH